MRIIAAGRVVVISCVSFFFYGTATAQVQHPTLTHRYPLQHMARSELQGYPLGGLRLAKTKRGRAARQRPQGHTLKLKHHLLARLRLEKKKNRHDKHKINKHNRITENTNT